MPPESAVARMPGRDFLGPLVLRALELRRLLPRALRSDVAG